MKDKKLYKNRSVVVGYGYDGYSFAGLVSQRVLCRDVTIARLDSFANCECLFSI